jgi:AcrR family transcriptional regulator
MQRFCGLLREAVMKEHLPAKRKPRADGLEAKARILDSAEALFSKRGFHGTSVRDITEHAKVRLASVNYHFVSKEILFRDVMLRRGAMLGRDRFVLLDQVGTQGTARRRTRAVVHAFVAPTALRAAESEGWRNYLALTAQVASSRLEALSLLAEYYNSAALRFVAALSAIHTDASQRAVTHSFSFMLASTLYAFSGNQRLDSLTGGALRSDDVQAIAEDLIEYCTAAIMHSCSL